MLEILSNDTDDDRDNKCKNPSILLFICQANDRTGRNKNGCGGGGAEPNFKFTSARIVCMLTFNRRPHLGGDRI